MSDNRGAPELLSPGHVIAEKFRIERMLAEGGMGTIMAGTHLQLDHPVALKFLRGDFRLDPEVLARFTSEAKVAAQLKSEHVARVLDAGATAGGTPYIVMEYLEGESLGTVLQIRGPLPVEVAVEYVIQACEGLAEAHARGIIHRDVKPYNLFLVERSSGWHAIKILDFGISKILSSAGSNVATGRIIGSPCYMSPEQLRSTGGVDHRTDLWSLGATLYELIAGTTAFDASLSLAELIAAILVLPARDLRELRPEVPPGLGAVVARCLAKDPGARFESAGSLAMALLPFAPARARVPAERAASMKPATSGLASDAGAAASVSLAPVASAPKNGARALKGWHLAAAGVVALAALAIPVFRALRLSAAFAGLSAVAAPASLAAAPTTRAAGSAQESTARTDEALSMRAARPGQSPDSVELVVRVTPQYARVSIDDRPVENPFRALYPRSASLHHITARAWGFETKTQDVQATTNTVFDLALQPRSQATGTFTPAAPVASPVTTTTADSGQRSRGSASPSPPDPTADVVSKGGGRNPLRPIDAKDPYAKP